MNIKKVALVSCVSLVSGFAYAEDGVNASKLGVNTSVGVGVEREWLELNQSSNPNNPGIQTHLFRAGVDVALDGIPVSGGVYGALVNVRDDDVNGAEESRGSEFGLNLKGHLNEDMTGLPVGFYLKAELPVYSEIQLSDYDAGANTDTETTWSHKSASKLSVGAQVAVMDGMNTFVEFAQGNRTYEVETSPKAAPKTKAESKFKTASMTLGVVQAL